MNMKCLRFCQDLGNKSIIGFPAQFHWFSCSFIGFPAFSLFFSAQFHLLPSTPLLLMFSASIAPTMLQDLMDLESQVLVNRSKRCPFGWPEAKARVSHLKSSSFVLNHRNRTVVSNVSFRSLCCSFSVIQ